MLTELLDAYRTACMNEALAIRAWTQAEEPASGVRCKLAGRSADAARAALEAHVAELSAERDELLTACRIVASAIRNLEGQPIQYREAMDLSAALKQIDLATKEAEERP